MKRKDAEHQKSKKGRLTLDFYSVECLIIRMLHLEWLMQIPLILTLKVSIMLREIFWLIEISYSWIREQVLEPPFTWTPPPPPSRLLIFMLSVRPLPPLSFGTGEYV